MEERVARLEANVDHIQTDVSEMKADIRRLDVKIDGVKDSVNSLRVEMKDAIGQLSLEIEKSFSKLRVERMIDRIWWLLISAAMLSVMGKAFKWI